jgi:hypothetical protein
MRIRTLALAGAATAVVAYLFDPVQGRERRGRLRISIRSLVDRRMHRTGPPALLPENVAPRQPRDVISSTEPTEPVRQAIPMPAGSQPEKTTAGAPDDGEIVHRVKAKLEARPDLRADDLVVDVVNGVVYLSGDLHDSRTFDEIVDVTGEVPGVRRVQSLLHLPDSETVSRSISARRAGGEGPGTTVP